MKLSEKIYECRKRAGLSQEALAERLGVSRQSVSKWETGDSEPEIGKLRVLAAVFGVTVDWLLSEEEFPREEPEGPADHPAKPAPSNWAESLPGVLGRLFRRYGWLAGVYIAIVGAAFLGIGGLSRFIAGRMFASFGSFGESFPSEFIVDEFGNVVENSMTTLAQNNPVSIMGGLLMVLGAVLLVGGTVLAVILKKKSREG